MDKSDFQNICIISLEVISLWQKSEAERKKRQSGQEKEVLASDWFQEKHYRNKNFFEITVNRYSDPDFRSHFRLTRTSVDAILNGLNASENFRDRSRRSSEKQPIPLLKSLLVTLWTVGSKETYRSIGDRFDMTKSTVFTCLDLIRTGIIEVFAKAFKWPSENERSELTRSFEQIGDLPGVIGAIDGTYIRIPKPKHDQQSYYNRKKFHSITLQAVCTADMKFTDCYIGWPSSVHDARILRNSLVFANAATLFHPHFYFLGDPAYPIRRWLMVPYKENGRLDTTHKNYNYRVSKTRVIIEQAFGLLKGRFRRLKILEIRNIEELNQTVLMCCILRNMTICEDDLEFISEPYTEALDNEYEIELEEGQEKSEGESKREWIRNYLANI